MAGVLSFEWAFTLHESCLRVCPLVAYCREEMSYSLRQNFVPPDNVKFLVAQLEKTPTTHAIHVQGYVEFMDQRTLKELKVDHALFGSAVRQAHFASAKGSRDENVAYCSKEETRAGGDNQQYTYERRGTTDETKYKEEVRVKEKHKRKREKAKESSEKATLVMRLIESAIKETTCVQTLYSMLAEKADSDRDDADIHRKAATQVRQSWKFFEQRIMSRKVDPTRPLRIRVVTVEVVIGKTGTGKTWECFERYGHEVYPKSIKNKWWDGYNGHKVVLLDEFTGDTKESGGYFTPDTLQAMLQGYPYFVECKSGTKEALWEHVYFTSNVKVDDWFGSWRGVDEGVKTSIMRRITVIREKVGEDRRLAWRRTVLPNVEGVVIEER